MWNATKERNEWITMHPLAYNVIESNDKNSLQGGFYFDHCQFCFAFSLLAWFLSVRLTGLNLEFRSCLINLVSDEPTKRLLSMLWNIVFEAKPKNSLMTSILRWSWIQYQAHCELAMKRRWCPTLTETLIICLFFGPNPGPAFHLNPK